MSSFWTLVQNGLQRVKKSIVLIYSQKHFVALTPKVFLEWWKTVDELLRYVESKEVFVRQFMPYKFMPENSFEIWQYMLFNLEVSDLRNRYGFSTFTTCSECWPDIWKKCEKHRAEFPNKRKIS